MFTTQTQVNSCFIVFDLSAPCQYTAQRNFEGHTIIERHGRFNCKLVQLAYPLAVYIACYIASKRRVNIPVGQYDSTGLKRGNYIMLGAVSKIRSMDQAKRRWRQQLLLLPLTGCLLHQRRRIPFTEENCITFTDYPLSQHRYLCSLAPAIVPLANKP